MTDTLEFTRLFKVDGLPPKGRTFDLDPDPSELAAVAERLGLVALNGLEGSVKLQPEMGRQYSLRGSIRAQIVQTCVVSGDSLATTITFEIDRTFAEDADPMAGLSAFDDQELTDPDIEEPDPIIEGKIDVGEHVIEELALNIPAYPRAPDAIFEPPQGENSEDNRPENPFSVLSSLKDKMESKD